MTDALKKSDGAEGIWTLFDGAEALWENWYRPADGKDKPRPNAVSKKMRCRVAFYAYGDDHTIGWRQQHLLQAHASLSCALAILFALAVAWSFQALSPTFGALGLFIGFCLVVAFLSQDHYSEQIQVNWCKLIGKDKLVGGMSQPGPTSDIIG